jgi:hypothetical protein
LWDFMLDRLSTPLRKSQIFREFLYSLARTVLLKCPLLLSHRNQNYNLLTNLSKILNITFLLKSAVQQSPVSTYELTEGTILIGATTRCESAYITTE